MHHAASLEPTRQPHAPAIAASGPSLAATVEINAATRARKAELLAEAARQLGDTARPDARQITMFKEFFYQLIDGCDKAERRRIAVALAANAYVPRPVVLYLALDDKEVAAPVLLFSPVLNEADIVLLAERLAFDHLQVLCRRDDLTPAAVKALLANGGPPAAALLARNVRTAHLSVARLIEQPDEAAPASAGRTPVSQRRAVGEAVVALAARGGRLGRAASAESRQQTTHRRLSTGGEGDLAQDLIAAARMGDRQQLAERIAGVAACAPRPVSNLIEETSIESLAVLLKGIGIDPISAGQLIMLLRPQAGASGDALAQAMRVFRRLDPQECRQFVAMLAGIAASREGVAADSGEAFSRAIAERRREVAIAPAARRPAATAARPETGIAFGRAGVRR